MPQTAFGPLVEPGWAGGAQMPGSPDIAGTFAHAALSTFQLTANMNAKQQALQNQLAMYALKQQQLEGDMDLKEKMFNIRAGQIEQNTALRERAMTTDAYFKNQASQIQAQRLGLAQDTFDAKRQDIDKRDDSIAGFANAKSDLIASGVVPGTHEYWTGITNAVAANPYLPSNQKNAALKEAGFNQNAAIKSQQDNVKAKEQEFMHRMSNTLYGTATNTDLQPVLDYNLYTKPEYAPQTWDDWFHNRPAQPTQNRLITIKDAQGKAIGTRKVPAQTLTDFNKEWQGIQAQRHGIAPMINDPTIGVTPNSMITIKSSTGRPWTIPNTPEAIQQAKQMDPGVTIVPQ